MSRCFPFPPPYYGKDAVKREHGKEEKKGKREKKEREGSCSKNEHDRSIHKQHYNKKRKHGDRDEPYVKVGCKKIELQRATEQLEKSGLTEEYGIPYAEQELCASSDDSTQSISRRTRKPESTTGSTIFRLKLPLKKLKGPEPGPTTNQAPFFSSPSVVQNLQAKRAYGERETYMSVRATPVVQEARTTNNSPCFSSRTSSMVPKATPAHESRCSSSGDAPAVPEARAGSESLCFSGTAAAAAAKVPEASLANGHINSSTRRSKTEKLERRFRDLIVNWAPAPPRLDGNSGEDDQVWLLGHRQRFFPSFTVKICGLTSSGENLSRRGGAVRSYQPRACFLPELDLYQLPYAVPF